MPALRLICLLVLILLANVEGSNKQSKDTLPVASKLQKQQTSIIPRMVTVIVSRARDANNLLIRNHVAAKTLRVIKKIGTVYVVSMGSLAVFRLRWKYIISGNGHGPRKLPVIKVVSQDRKSVKPAIILLHGMWHDASFYAEQQQLLAKEGYSSYAIDLLPGERFIPGGTQKEVVRDLEWTIMDRIDIRGPIVLIGHSQGGLIAQAALQQSKFLQQRTQGVVLMGSIPLGFTPPLSDIKKQEQTVLSDPWSFLWVCLFGKLRNAEYARRIFLLNETDTTTPEMASYMDKLQKAPSDGYIVGTHPMSGTPKTINHIPALILGAKHDIIYPPHLMTREFDKRFSSATHYIVDNQAHCFRDNGWQDALLKPILEWMENLETGILERMENLKTGAMMDAQGANP